jgi:hypothetical protein
MHYNSEHAEKYKTVSVFCEMKSGGFEKEGLSHKRISSESNPMAVPLNCGQVTVLSEENKPFLHREFI